MKNRLLIADALTLFMWSCKGCLKKVTESVKKESIIYSKLKLSVFYIQSPLG